MTRARITLACTAFAALLATGCPPLGRPGFVPATRQEALRSVNDNLAQLTSPLQYKGLVSFRFRDEKGHDRSFIGHDASIIYAPPRGLRFDVRSLAGTIARFGSNDEQYWVWVDLPDLRKLWFGAWHNAADPVVARRLPVPPNDLVDALMLRPIPEPGPDSADVVLRVVGNDARLLYWLGQPGGHRLLREIKLDTKTPNHDPREVTDRTPEGEIVMQATLDNYKPIGPDGPRTPRRYVVQWPQQHAEMRLDVTSARFRPEIEPDLFAFPTGWKGEWEQIDENAAPPADEEQAWQP